MFHRSRPVLRPRRGSFEVACRDGAASDSRQGGFEVHGQDGGANPHLRTLHTMVSDTVQPAVVLSVAEGTLNAVALPLLFLEPAFRGFPVVFRTTQGFEGGADSPLLHQPAILPGSVKAVCGEGGRQFPEPLLVRCKLTVNDFPGGFGVVVVTELVEKQEAADMAQGSLGAELGVLAASLAALDGADIVAMEADNPSVNPMLALSIHFHLLLEDPAPRLESLPQAILHEAPPLLKRPDKFLQLSEVAAHKLEHLLFRPAHHLSTAALLLGERQKTLLRLAARGAAGPPQLSTQRLDVPNQPLAHVVEQPHIIRMLHMLRKHRRVGQHPLGPDDLALDQKPMRLLLHALEEPNPQTLAKLRQRTGLQRRIRDELLEAAEGLLIHVLPNRLHHFPVTQPRQMLQQNQAEEQTRVRLRTAQM